MRLAIPPQRLPLYLGAALFLLLGALTMHEWSRWSHACKIREEICLKVQEVALRQSRQSSNRRVRSQFCAANHFYIDQHLEKVQLLEAERKALTNLLKEEPDLPSKQVIIRLEQLKKNRLCFAEEQVQVYAAMQEVIEKLLEPVEVDAEDLSLLLTLIEGKEIGEQIPLEDRPQLLMTDFKLERKSIDEDREVYLLDMKLLKREFLSTTPP